MPPPIEPGYKLSESEFMEMKNEIISINKEVGDLISCRDTISSKVNQLTIETVSLKNEIIKTNENLKEILDAWNSGKGFVKTSKNFSKLIVWVSITLAATSSIIASTGLWSHITKFFGK